MSSGMRVSMAVMWMLELFGTGLGCGEMVAMRVFGIGCKARALFPLSRRRPRAIGIVERQ